MHRHDSLQAFWLFLVHTILLSSMAAVLGNPIEIAINTDVEIEVETGGCASDLSGSPWIHDVMLRSSGGQTFAPAFVQAGIGEVIRITRQRENVTLGRSSFSSPCSPSRSIDMLLWNPSPDDGRNETFLVVQSLEPQWFYTLGTESMACSPDTVFAINPGSKWTEFVARADMRRSGNSSQPSPSVNVSTQVSTASHNSTSASIGISLSSPVLTHDTSSGVVWYPWTTTVATVTSFVTM